MARLDTKIRLYAKANGVNSVDFLTDVIVEQQLEKLLQLKLGIYLLMNLQQIN